MNSVPVEHSPKRNNRYNRENNDKTPPRSSTVETEGYGTTPPHHTKNISTIIPTKSAFSPGSTDGTFSASSPLISKSMGYTGTARYNNNNTLLLSGHSSVTNSPFPPIVSTTNPRSSGTSSSSSSTSYGGSGIYYSGNSSSNGNNRVFAHLQTPSVSTMENQNTPFSTNEPIPRLYFMGPLASSTSVVGTRLDFSPVTDNDDTSMLNDNGNNHSINHHLHQQHSIHLPGPSSLLTNIGDGSSNHNNMKNIQALPSSLDHGFTTTGGNANTPTTLLLNSVPDPVDAFQSLLNDSRAPNDTTTDGSVMSSIPLLSIHSLKIAGRQNSTSSSSSTPLLVSGSLITNVPQTSTSIHHHHQQQQQQQPRNHDNGIIYRVTRALQQAQPQLTSTHDYEMSVSPMQISYPQDSSSSTSTTVNTTTDTNQKMIANASPSSSLKSGTKPLPVALQTQQNTPPNQSTLRRTTHTVGGSGSSLSVIPNTHDSGTKGSNTPLAVQPMMMVPQVPLPTIESFGGLSFPSDYPFAKTGEISTNTGTPTSQTISPSNKGKKTTVSTKVITSSLLSPIGETGNSNGCNSDTKLINSYSNNDSLGVIYSLDMTAGLANPYGTVNTIADNSQPNLKNAGNDTTEESMIQVGELIVLKGTVNNKTIRYLVSPSNREHSTVRQGIIAASLLNNNHTPDRSPTEPQGGDMFLSAESNRDNSTVPSNFSTLQSLALASPSSSKGILQSTMLNTKSSHPQGGSANASHRRIRNPNTVETDDSVDMDNHPNTLSITAPISSNDCNNDSFFMTTPNPADSVTGSSRGHSTVIRSMGSNSNGGSNTNILHSATHNRSSPFSPIVANEHMNDTISTNNMPIDGLPRTSPIAHSIEMAGGIVAEATASMVRVLPKRISFTGTAERITREERKGTPALNRLTKYSLVTLSRDNDTITNNINERSSPMIVSSTNIYANNGSSVSPTEDLITAVLTRTNLHSSYPGTKRDRSGTVVSLASTCEQQSIPGNFITNPMPFDSTIHSVYPTAPIMQQYVSSNKSEALIHSSLLSHNLRSSTVTEIPSEAHSVGATQSTFTGQTILLSQYHSVPVSTSDIHEGLTFPPRTVRQRGNVPCNPQTAYDDGTSDESMIPNASSCVTNGYELMDVEDSRTDTILPSTSLLIKDDKTIVNATEISEQYGGTEENTSNNTMYPTGLSSSFISEPSGVPMRISLDNLSNDRRNSRTLVAATGIVRRLASDNAARLARELAPTPIASVPHKTTMQSYSDKEKNQNDDDVSKSGEESDRRSQHIRRRLIRGRPTPSSTRTSSHDISSSSAPSDSEEKKHYTTNSLRARLASALRYPDNSSSSSVPTKSYSSSSSGTHTPSNGANSTFKDQLHTIYARILNKKSLAEDMLQEKEENSKIELPSLVNSTRSSLPSLRGSTEVFGNTVWLSHTRKVPPYLPNHNMNNCINTMDNTINGSMKDAVVSLNNVPGSLSLTLNSSTNATTTPMNVSPSRPQKNMSSKNNSSMVHESVRTPPRITKVVTNYQNAEEQGIEGDIDDECINKHKSPNKTDVSLLSGNFVVCTSGSSSPVISSPAGLRFSRSSSTTVQNGESPIAHGTVSDTLMHETVVQRQPSSLSTITSSPLRTSSTNSKGTTNTIYVNVVHKNNNKNTSIVIGSLNASTTVPTGSSPIKKDSSTLSTTTASSSSSPPLRKSTIISDDNDTLLVSNTSTSSSKRKQPVVTTTNRSSLSQLSTLRSSPVQVGTNGSSSTSRRLR